MVQTPLGAVNYYGGIQVLKNMVRWKDHFIDVLF